MPLRAGLTYRRSCAGMVMLHGAGKRRGRGKQASQSRGAATYAFTKAILHHRGYWGSDIL